MVNFVEKEFFYLTIVTFQKIQMHIHVNKAILYNINLKFYNECDVY